MMERIKNILLSLGLLILVTAVQAQKKVSELTLTYDATVDGSNPQLAAAFKGATSTIHLKGTLCRLDVKSNLASFTTIHDAKTGSAVMLQEVSGQKLLIRLSPADWKDKNKKFEGIAFQQQSDTKIIAGYTCKKAIATLKDGTSFTVYYTSDLQPVNTQYSSQFSSLQGLPLEYELKQGTMTIKYTASKVNLDPVPASTFDIPKSGYREMTYDESRKMGM